MELKSYQKKVIADLTRYLELLNETQNYMTAFEQFWREKSAPALGRYQNVIPGVPNLCFKVPTAAAKPSLPATPFALSLTRSPLPRQRRSCGLFHRTRF